MYHNPFDASAKLEIGYDRENGYFVASTHMACNVTIQFGHLASTLALTLKANGVRHFDYHPSLLDDADQCSRFIQAAEAVGWDAYFSPRPK